jgi:hypothetical protein
MEEQNLNEGGETPSVEITKAIVLDPSFAKQILDYLGKCPAAEAGSLYISLSAAKEVQLSIPKQ